MFLHDWSHHTFTPAKTFYFKEQLDSHKFTKTIEFLMPLLVMKGYITLVLNKTIGGGDGEIILCELFDCSWKKNWWHKV